jgi:hypothetical protein
MVKYGVAGIFKLSLLHSRFDKMNPVILDIT